MQIKTLAEILAESDTDSASSAASSKIKRAKNTTKRAKPTQTELFNQRQAKKQQRSESQATTDFDSQNDYKNYSNTEQIDDTQITDENESHFSEKPRKSSQAKSIKRKKRFHPAAPFIAAPSDTPTYVPPEAQSVKQMLAEVKRQSVVNDESTTDVSDSADPLITSDYLNSLTASEIDNLPSALKAYLRSPEQKQAEIDAIKAESRLRWLAFYYLSRREYGKAELRQKLIDKEQDLESINALLDEFEQKGYQSDYRTTLMLIRENLRKGRGRARIKQDFYKKKIAMPSNIDELIDMANAESEAFSEFVDEDENSLVEGVDWLKLAVEARTKKYGNDIPVEQKDKAKQLRFLQYRGFKGDVCFEALNYTLDTLDERF